MADTQVENEFLSRAGDRIKATTPGIDPNVILPTILELILDLGKSCFGGNTTPEAAVAGVSNLSVFQRAALRAKAKRAARDAGIPNANKAAVAACDAIEHVAKEAKPEERIAFAKTMLPLASDDEFTMI